MHLSFQRLIITIIVAMALAGVIADIIVRPAPMPARQQPSAITANVSLATLSNKLSKVLTDTYPALHPGPPDQANPIGYRPPGYNFQIILPAANSLSFSDNQASDTTSAYQYFQQTGPLITRYFNQQAYQALATSSNDSLISVRFYMNHINICQVTMYRLLDVSCSPLSTLDQAARQLQPLAELYAQAAPDTGNNSFSVPLETASKSAGYRLATTTVNNSSGATKLNFYRQNNTSWQLINLGWYNDPTESGDITPNCGDFESNPQTRAAYDGQPCYDSDAHTIRTIK